MPINVFGNSFSSNNIGDKKDTSLFVQKRYLRTYYIGSNIKEDIDKIKKIPNPVHNTEAVSQNYVDNKIIILVK